MGEHQFWSQGTNSKGEMMRSDIVVITGVND